ncbi:GNAT family N-acetyltransferase [Herbaspirillum sp. HC18]|nr:GNAT family N-acetyltransferase [Herbaspirillum sp. HC18]
MLAIRAPRPIDLPAIQALLDSNALPSSDLTEDHLKHFIVLAQASRIAGSVGLEIHGENALLRSLAVDTMMRGEGLGARLLELIEERAQDLGVRQLYLLTTSAATFFEHNGYDRIERAAVPETIRNTRQFTGICPSSATCLSKKLI